MSLRVDKVSLNSFVVGEFFVSLSFPGELIHRIFAPYLNRECGDRGHDRKSSSKDKFCDFAVFSYNAYCEVLLYLHFLSSLAQRIIIL